MTRLLVAMVLAGLLSGCAWCREKPLACGAAIVVVGAVAARELDRSRDRAPAPTARCPNPAPGACI